MQNQHSTVFTSQSVVLRKKVMSDHIILVHFCSPCCLLSHVAIYGCCWWRLVVRKAAGRMREGRDIEDNYEYPLDNAYETHRYSASLFQEQSRTPLSSVFLFRRSSALNFVFSFSAMQQFQLSFIVYRASSIRHARPKFVSIIVLL